MAINQIESKWKINIKKMLTNGLCYPVFRWTYNSRSRFSSGGELFTNIAATELVLRKEGVRVAPGKSNIRRFSSASQAIETIKEYGWEEPPYIYEVFQIMVSAKGKFPMKATPESRDLLKGVQTQWEALIGQENKKTGVEIISTSDRTIFRPATLRAQRNGRYSGS